MYKVIAIAVLSIGVVSPALAATAFWTGRSEMTTSVTYRQVWNCEYNYAGNTFWRAFAGSCLSSVEVY